MPLLHKKPFVRNKVPPSLSPNHELFYCQSTNEVFEDYEEFFQRIILCNSLVWTCETTGRPGLTYDEAIESESRAKKILSDFPDAMKKPLLYLASCTRRGRLADLCDDVFIFAKDRFFVGDIVEHTNKNLVRKQCVVIKIVSTNQSCEVLKPSQCNYEIQDVDSGDMFEVAASAIYRKKGCYTREKNKLYLKQATQPVAGIWAVKEKFLDKYQLRTTEFSEIFVGKMPQFKISPIRRGPQKGKTNSKVKEASENKSNTEDANLKNKARQSEENLKLRKEAAKKKMEEEKKIKKEEKLKEREKKLEERKIMARYQSEWSRPREDLILEDLKDLPVPAQVHCKIPQEFIGDVLMIQQFFEIFSEVLELDEYFPNGLEFDTLQTALLSSDVDNPLKDIIQFLLESIYSMQDANKDHIAVQDHNGFLSIPDEKEFSIKKASEQADTAFKYCIRNLGTTVNNLVIDSYTLTEIVRLHLLSSGSSARKFEGCPQNEDPGLVFKLEHPDVMQELAVKSIFFMSIENKLKVINVLIHQLLANEYLREYIDDALANVRQNRNELRMLRWSESQREREFTSRFKKYSDARTLERYYKAKEDIETENKNAETKEISSENLVDEELEKIKRMTDRQWQEYSEKSIKEEAKKKETFLKEERTLMDALTKNQIMSCVAPLGRDRAFRRYWLFTCIPGLFVEDNDLQFMGRCLSSPTPYNPDLKPGDVGTPEVTLASMKRYIERKSDEGPNSDKENEDQNSSDEKMTKKVKSGNETGLSEQNGDVYPAVNKIANNIDEIEKMEIENTPIFGMCTANQKTCPVHSRNAKRHLWNVFSSVDSIENLLSNLNPRGHREKELLENLKNEKWRLYDHLASCKSKLESLMKENKFSIISNKPNEKIFELNLRDSINDLEEKIYHGTLGNLNVNDRIIWRTAIENDSFDLQCSNIEWCGNIISSIDEISVGEDSHKEEDKVVKSLACAILQLAQGIDPKYLKQPLGEDAELKKQKMAESLIKKLEKKSLEPSSDHDQKSIDENESNLSSPMLKRSALDRWSDSLMNCTSVSQLFLHISILEKSVEWSRSVLNAKCKICRRKGDAENMLLCDECDRGHHMYCLKPPLTNIPKGRWFCPSCHPKKTPRKRKASPRKKQKIEESEEEDLVDDAESFKQSDESIQDQSVSDMEVEETKSNISSECNESCEKCGKSGKLVECSKCEQFYHLHCVTPKLKKMPNKKWLCSSCSQIKEKKDKKEFKSVLSVPTLTKRSSRVRNAPKNFNEFEVEQTSPTNDLRPARRSSSGRRSFDGSLALNFKICDDLLTQLTKHEDGWLFLRPVTKKDAHDYHLIIKNPMDFGTMRGKLNNVLYKDNNEFIADATLVFKNCEVYNPDESLEFKAGKRLQKFFENRLKQMGLKIKSENNGSEPPNKRRR